MKKPVLAIAACLLAVAFTRAGDYDQAVKSLEAYPDYVRPAATLLGTISNNEWIRPAEIGQDFRFTLGLPITITEVANKDRYYDNTFMDPNTDKPALLNGKDSAYYRYVQSYRAPTIFGRDPAPMGLKYFIVAPIDTMNSDPVKDTFIVVAKNDKLMSDGIDKVAQFNWFPMVMLQTGISGYWTELRFHYVGVPFGSIRVNMFGVGLQHDIAWLIPKSPVHVSAICDLTFPHLRWFPGDGITGSFVIKGISSFVGVSVCKPFDCPTTKHFRGFDLNANLGWEYCRISTGGSMHVLSDDSYVKPNMKLVGRNTIRLSLSCDIRTRHTVHGAGYSFGAERATSINFLSLNVPMKRINSRIAASNKAVSVSPTTTKTAEAKPVDSKVSASPVVQSQVPVPAVTAQDTAKAINTSTDNNSNVQIKEAP